MYVCMCVSVSMCVSVCVCMYILCMYACTYVRMCICLIWLSATLQVPRVFIGGESIGGCDETVALYERGKLVPRLKELGAINI